MVERNFLKKINCSTPKMVSIGAGKIQSIRKARLSTETSPRVDTWSTLDIGVQAVQWPVIHRREFFYDLTNIYKHLMATLSRQNLPTNDGAGGSEH